MASLGHNGLKPPLTLNTWGVIWNVARDSLTFAVSSRTQCNNGSKLCLCQTDEVWCLVGLIQRYWSSHYNKYTTGSDSLLSIKRVSLTKPEITTWLLKFLNNKKILADISLAEVLQSINSRNLHFWWYCIIKHPQSPWSEVFGQLQTSKKSTVV